MYESTYVHPRPDKVGCQESLRGTDARVREVVKGIKHRATVILGTNGRATPVEVSHRMVDSDMGRGLASSCNEDEVGIDCRWPVQLPWQLRWEKNHPGEH